MSTSYHTTNSLCNVKTQSERMTFSPYRELKRSTGEWRCSSAQLYEPVSEGVSVLALKLGQPAERVCVFLPMACVRAVIIKQREKYLIKKGRACSQRECGRRSVMGHSLVKSCHESKKERLFNMKYFFFSTVQIHLLFIWLPQQCLKKCIWLTAHQWTHLWHQL